MKPVRVLYVTGGPLDFGGISSYMLNYVSRFDREKVEVDFAVHGMEEGPREAETEKLGCRVHHVPYKRPDYSGNRSALLNLFASGGYDAVHAHMDGMNGYVLGLAKAAGVPVRISHCHNTQFLTRNPARLLLHRLTAQRIPHVATHLLACSEPAARFLYGAKLTESGRVRLIKNAVEPAAYAFSEAARTQLRTELTLDGRFVICHIGRFEYQKNHPFLLQAFQKLAMRRPDAVLLLVGDGADRPAIERQIAALGLETSVRLLGYRKDVAALLSASDLFVLPSHFEGLGIVLVEAQASGLPCIASDAVPRDAAVTDCTFLPIKDPGAWAAAMNRLPAAERSMNPARFIECGYDIARETQNLQSFYEALRV